VKLFEAGRIDGLHIFCVPSVVIPILLGVAILAALLGISNMAQVLAVMEGFQYRYLLYVLVAPMVRGRPQGIVRLTTN